MSALAAGGWRRLPALGLGATGVLALVLLAAPEVRLPLILEGVALPLGGEPRAVAFTLLLDRLSLSVVAFISLIGLVVHRFALRYLCGDPARPRFLRALVLTVVAAQLLVVSGNLALFALAWVLVSTGLNVLLTHHAERAGALRAARKKFLVSRLGDAWLLVALGVLLHRFGTLELARLFALCREPLSASAEASLGQAALALVLAALCKSAQVPLHGWLPETLEAPTPVSALMHAGIINAGGYLLIRVSPLLGSAGAALGVLVISGTVTAAVGLVAMWAQTDVKKGLAWSTVSQMGFMMLQCGLGAFAGALLHLIGHGLYKADAFLRSGTVAHALERRHAQVLSPRRALARLALGLVLAALAMAATWGLMGLDPLHHPGGLVLSLVLGLGLAQVPLLNPRGGGALSLAVPLAVMLVLSGLAAAGLVAAQALVGPSVGSVPQLWERGALGVALTVAVALVFTGLGVLSALLPWLSRQPGGLALFVHASHGFYADMAMERALRALWPSGARTPRPTSAGLSPATELHSPGAPE